MLHQNSNHREILAAGRDVVAIGVGAAPTHPHPLSDNLTLRDLAFAAGSMLRKQSQSEPDQAVIARGLTTSDFSKTLADGVGGLVQRIYSAQAEHLRFCSMVPTKYLGTPTQLPGIDADLELEPLVQGAEVRHGAAFTTAGASNAILKSFAKTVFVSRELVVNDDLGALGRIFGALGSSAGRVESRIVAKTLETPNDLDDGAAFFSLNAGNLVADSGLTATTLSAAMSFLRNQMTASGNRADLALKHLVVSSELELTARLLVFSSGLPNVEITVLATLPSARWYALADPLIAPVVGLLRLAGSKSPVLVEQSKKRFSVDGAPVGVVADLGCALLGRVGIVRCGVSA